MTRTKFQTIQLLLIITTLSILWLGHRTLDPDYTTFINKKQLENEISSKQEKLQDVEKRNMAVAFQIALDKLQKQIYDIQNSNNNLQNENNKFKAILHQVVQKTRQVVQETVENKRKQNMEEKPPSVTNPPQRAKKKTSYMEYVRVPLCDDPEPGGNNILSYSLFGKRAVHIGRFIKDVSEEARSLEVYKDFTLRIYVDQHLPETIRTKFKSNFTNVRFCDVRKIPKYGDISKHIGTVWRFLAIGDMTIDVFCSRDLDTPLIEREADAVKEWLGTTKIFHVMRDRDVHSSSVMGGLWCFRNKKNAEFGQELLDLILEKSSTTTNTRDDQTIMNFHIWPKLKDDSLQHDAYSCKHYRDAKPFPTQRKDYFVGCVRDCWVFDKIKCPVECRPHDHKDWEYC